MKIKNICNDKIGIIFVIKFPWSLTNWPLTVVVNLAATDMCEANHAVKRNSNIHMQINPYSLQRNKILGHLVTQSLSSHNL